MELDNLKEVWQKEKEELQHRIHLNEKIIQNLSLDKPKGVLDKQVNAAIFGRNMALVYMTISFVVAFMTYEEYMYFILSMIGGLSMLFSFTQHLSIQKPNLSQMSAVELQKSIIRFRMHTEKHAIYDMFVVALWLLTVLPPLLIIFLKIQISYLQLVSILLIVVVLMILASKDMYKKLEEELKENEEQLQRVLDFEIQ